MSASTGAAAEVVAEDESYDGEHGGLDQVDCLLAGGIPPCRLNRLPDRKSQTDQNDDREQDDDPTRGPGTIFGGAKFDLIDREPLPLSPPPPGRLHVSPGFLANLQEQVLAWRASGAPHAGTEAAERTT